MARRKALRLITAALGLGAGGVIFFGPSSMIVAQARDETPAKTIEVGIEFRGGNFFFSPDTPIEINAGDSIVWVPKRGMHELVPDSEKDPFEPTDQFTMDSPAKERTRTFKTPGVINYHCALHPRTMKQKITVKPAKSP